MSKQDEMLGQEGLDYFADTDAHTPGGGKPHWVTVQAHGAAAVVASLSLSNSNVATIASFTLAQGEAFFGQVTSITLTSGAVRCYRNTL